MLSRNREPALRRSGRTASSCVLVTALGLAAVAACGQSSESEFKPGGGNDTTGGGTTAGTTVGSTGGLQLDQDGGITEVAASALEFDPPAVTIVVDGSGSLTRTFTLKATLKDGSVRTVQGRTLQFDRPDIAAVAPGDPIVVTAKGSFAGTGTLNAVYGGASAKATVTVTIRQRELSAGGSGVLAVTEAEANALDAKATSAITNDPNVGTGDFLYPYDKTVFPLGLPAPLSMWKTPDAADVYRFRLEEENYTYDYYARAAVPSGAGNAEVRIPQAAWDRVTASSRGASDPLKLTVSRLHGGVGGQAYTSVVRTFGIAVASARGAIYYWTASQAAGGERVGHITKIQPGTGAAPVKLNEGKCMGCHAVSADGSTLTATVEVRPTDPGDITTTDYPSLSPFQNWSKTRPWVSFALPAATQIKKTTMSGANTALTPEGKYVVFGGRSKPEQVGTKYLGLADTATGTIVTTSKLDDVKYDGSSKGVYDQTPGSMMMPAFSPDGTKLAVVEGGSGDVFDNVIPKSPKAIFYLDFDKSKPAFDPNGHVIVRADAAIFGTKNGDLVQSADGTGSNLGLGYPTFTPDSKYVAYHTGHYSTGCETGCLDEDYDTGEIWLSAVDGSKHVRLDALNGGPATLAKSHLNREPTFNPAERGGYFWVVFTSMREWGHYNKPAGTGGTPVVGDYDKLTGLPVNANRRLWVAAIDKTTGSVDPSHPAFYLEGQSNEPNMRGFWALSACIATPPAGQTGPACTAGFECCSGFCDNGQCVDPSQLACRGSGDTCTTAADCCNPSVVSCVDGKCTPNPVK